MNFMKHSIGIRFRFISRTWNRAAAGARGRLGLGPPVGGADLVLAGAAAPLPGGPGARAGPMAGPDTTRHWADAGAGAGPAPTTTAARAAVLVCGYTVRDTEGPVGG
jgi:hypothetical protein